jgi:two-component system sensor histidine kinase YesM
MRLTNKPGHYNWFHNLLIRSKITLVYVPLIIVPLLALGLAASHMYTKAIVERTVQNVSDNSSLIISQLSGMLNNAHSTANMLTLNLNKVLAEGTVSGDGQVSELQRYTQITNQLSYALVVFHDVESAAFVDVNGLIYGSSAALEQNRELAAASPLLERLRQSNGALTWFPMQTRRYLVMNESAPVLTLGKRIVNINTGSTLGYLFLNIKESDLSAVYGSIDSVQHGTYMIVDEHATVISSQQAEAVLKEVAEPSLRKWVLEHAVQTEVKQLEQGKTLLISTDIPDFSWRLISLVPYKLLTEETGQLALLVALIGLVCFSFAIIGARMLSNVIAKPIIRLARQMKKVNEGNLNQQIEVASADEIGLLASGFNTMLARVQELLSNIGAEQRKKREYELALMQAQIKPHFLYNTLDVIYTLSEMGRSRDVQRTTKSLADFYRAALSQGRDLIELETEIRSLKDYLSIQRIRYSDVFDLFRS